MALSDYLGGAKKRKEQIDKVLSEGTPSVRAKQPVAQKVQKPTAKPNAGKKCPMWIRSGDCARLGYNSK